MEQKKKELLKKLADAYDQGQTIPFSPPVPPGIEALLIEREKEKEAIKKQRRHDYLIATYGIVGGLISGLATSLIVLWLEGLL